MARFNLLSCKKVKILICRTISGEECGMEDFSINEMQKMQRSLQDKYKDR